MARASMITLIFATGMIETTFIVHAEDNFKPRSATTTTAPSDADLAEHAAFQRAMQTFEPAMDASDNGHAVDFVALREAMGRFWAEFPNVHKSATLLTFYMDMFAKAHPERVGTEWASFVECSSPVAAEVARGKVRFAEVSRHPFEFSFVAMDGRVIDLGKLRGKVVLIDFWATWCTPCIKQIPAMKRLYSALHEQGFEIIGISLDRPEDKQKLIDFLSNEKLAWPQLYDGRAWQNELVVRYGVNSAPTTFLLDKEGNLGGDGSGRARAGKPCETAAQPAGDRSLILLFVRAGRQKVTSAQAKFAQTASPTCDVDAVPPRSRVWFFLSATTSLHA
jgi:thiol-disulfide isomerase/thioredoxin